MMKRSIIILCIYWMGWFNISCSDFLEGSSQDEVIVKSVSDFSELLLGAGYPDILKTYHAVLLIADDDVMVNESLLKETENNEIVTRFGFFTWQPDMWDRTNNAFSYNNGYEQSYNCIMGCNAVLDGLDEAIGDRELLERTKAEALALRAWYYFELVNIYAKPYNDDKESPGLVLKLTADMVDNGIKRSSVKEVYDRIVTDLNVAAKLFEKYEVTRGDFRINLHTVYILLSRTYLFMEQWENAEKAATLAIKNGGALSDFTKIESPFELNDYEVSEIEWLFANGYKWQTQGLTSNFLFTASDDLKRLYDPNDKRLQLWFTGASVSKFGTYRTFGRNIRIAEAYLNRAEAYVQQEKFVEAASDLNTLREHRIVGYTREPIPNTRLLEEIRLERRLEFCLEGFRWMDLRRYGMPSITHYYRASSKDPQLKYVLEEKDPLYTIPIPSTITERNNLLEQNVSRYAPLREGNNVIE